MVLKPQAFQKCFQDWIASVVTSPQGRADASNFVHVPSGRQGFRKNLPALVRTQSLACARSLPRSVTALQSDRKLCARRGSVSKTGWSLRDSISEHGVSQRKARRRKATPCTCGCGTLLHLIGPHFLSATRSLNPLRFTSPLSSPRRPISSRSPLRSVVPSPYAPGLRRCIFVS
jgi:hypothetical protein